MEYQKIVVATGDLIGNKFDNRITKVSKNSKRELQMRMIKKYLKKNINLLMGGRKLRLI